MLLRALPARIRTLAACTLHGHTPGKCWRKSCQRRPPAVRRTLSPLPPPCSSSVLSECRCYPRLPAGGYLTTTSRPQGADASAASSRAQRSADQRRAHQVVAVTASTDQHSSARAWAAPQARRSGSIATAGRAARVRCRCCQDASSVCPRCAQLVVRRNLQVVCSSRPDTL